MNWPLPQDFNEAVQNPGTAFTDPDLKAGQAVVGPQGLPLPRSGNFADVYQIRTAAGRDWAVKCFTRPVTGLEHRYAKVDAALDRAGLPFTIGFTFLNEGVRARGQWLPALKMEWVDGLLLNQVVRDQAGNPKVLDALGQMWARLSKRLREAGIAHADLQHGNVLLVPGSRPGAYGLKLIDYDGMYVPALANNPSGEAGHPNYQHPVRATKQVYSPDLDRFPHLVIATALKGLAVLGASLWERYDTGDNLLFTDEDFRNPAESKLMRDLWQAKNPGLQALVGHLAIACGRPIPQTPWLDQIAPDGIAVPLSPEQERAATVALGLTPPAPVVPTYEAVKPVAAEDFGAALPPVPRPAPVVIEPAVDLPSFEVEREVGPGRRKRQQQSSVPPLLIVGGVFLLLTAVAGAVVGGIFLLGGKKPDEVAQTQPNPDDPPEKDQKPKEKPKPAEKEKDPSVDGGPRPPINPIVTAQPSGPVDVASLPRLPVRWEKPTPHGGGISRMAFTADSKLLAVAGYGRKDVRVLDAKTGITSGGFTEHETPVLGLASLPGGEIASLGADEAFALVWEPGTGRGKAKILCPGLSLQKPEPFLYTSRDGRYLMCGGTESDTGQPAAVPPPPIEVTDTDTGKPVVSFRMSWGVARFTADSTRLVVADDRTGLLQVFRLPTGQLASEAKAESGHQPALAVAVSPDGRFAVFLGKSDLPGGRGYNVHEVATGRYVRTIPIRPTAGFRSGFSPDGKWFRLVHTTPGGSEVVLVDTTTWTPQAVAAVGNTQGVQWDHGPQFSRDGKLLAIPKAGGRVVAFELPRDGVALVPPKPKDPGPVSPVNADEPNRVWSVNLDPPLGTAGVYFARDGSAVMVGGGVGAGVRAFDAQTGEVLPKPQGVNILTAAFPTPLDTDRFAAYIGPNPENLIVAWHARTGLKAGRVTVPDFPGTELFNLLKLSPDGRFLAVGRDQPVRKNPTEPNKTGADPAPFRVFDATAGRALVSLEAFHASAHFTSDSARVLVAEWTGRFRWFKLPSGEPDGEWTFPTDAPNPGLNRVLRVSADGSRLLFHGRPPGREYGFYLLDGKTGDVVQAFGLPYRHGALSADGRVVALFQMTRLEDPAAVEVFDAVRGVAVARVGVAMTKRFLPALDLSPDGRKLTVYDPNTNALSLYDLAPAAVAVAPPKPKDSDPVVVKKDPAYVNGGELKPLWSSPAPATAGWSYATFTSDGQTVVIGTSNRGITSFAARTGAPLPAASAVREGESTLIPLDRGRVGVHISREGTVVVWDPQTGQATGKVPVPDPKPRGGVVTLSPNERYLVVGHPTGFRPKPGDPMGGGTWVPGELRVYDTTTGKDVVKTEWYSESIHFTADSSRVLVSESNGRFRWFKLPSGEAAEDLTVGPRPSGDPSRVIGISADGRLVLYDGHLASDRWKRAVYALDGKTGKVIRRVSDSSFGPGAITPDGRLFARFFVNPKEEGGASVEITHVDQQGPAVRFKVVKEVKNPLMGFGLSPDGRSFAVYDLGNNQVAVYDLSDNLVAVGPKPRDPEPKPKDPEPKPKDPEPRPGPKPVDRKPVPDDAALTQAETQVREKLKDDYAKKSVAEKKAFATKLIGLAEKQADDPVARYVMLRDARDVAVETADAVLAAEAVDGLARWYEVEGGRLKHAALEKIREATTSAAALRAVAEVALAGADTAFAADDYEAAAKLAQTAAEAARRANLSAAIVDEAEAEAALARKAGSAFGEVKLALDRLKANPDDTDAALTVGKYRCYTQGRWEEGLKLLAKGGGPALKAVAELDANTPRDGSPDAKAADAWWDYAQTAPDAEKRVAEARARHWYALALPKLAGDQKTQAETRLALTYNGADYRQGLVAEFAAKVPSVLQGKKGRVDPVVVFSGGEFSDAGVGRATDISVKWTGVIVPPGPGRYRLVANTTDPVRVRVDGKVVIDTISSKTGRREGTIGLPDRPSPVTIEFPCINTDRHQLKLCWTRAGSDAEALIPPEVLFHDRKLESAIGK
ncbi:MAG: hypothetical protein JWO38_2513 [Gemmataceae bacterium]|nr:hypothetical protein [Gemmataceae bacterium]